MYVQAHAHWGVLAATFLVLNSRCGCILSFVHGTFCILMYNIFYVRDIYLKWITFYWRNGTPFQHFPSPCLPEKEFQETELHFDKSTAFGPKFFDMQKTWHCGMMFSIIEIVLCGVVAILITKNREQDTEEFKKMYGPRFDKKIKQN